MTNERSVFEAAIEIKDVHAREDYLRAACGGDTKLRGQVESLLEFYEGEPTFLNEHNLLSHRLSGTSLPNGYRVGRYKLLEPIGEGGFGVVFLAKQSEPMERTVALKLIKPGMDTRQVITRFNAERQALARMDHPYIARVLDGGSTDDGRPYFVMEFVDGVPITEFCDTHRLTTTARLELFIRVCHAIQHAHQKGIVHRDIKPSNVLVSFNDGEAVPRVIDFGIGKAIGHQSQDNTQMTGQGQTIGTPQYMSPEQAESRGAEIDTRSDVYSLGIVLYELLTGRTPLDKSALKSVSDEELRLLIREKEAPTPSSKIEIVGEAAHTLSKNRGTEPKPLRQLLKGELDWVTLKAVKKERDLRYISPIALAEDIDRFLKRQPVSAGPPSSIYRIRKFVGRNRGWVAAVVTVSLSILVGLTISLIALFQLKQTVNELQVARDEVGLQVSIAESNFDLMEGMLTAVDPDAGNGTDVTVLQMLEQYAEDLHIHLANKPPQVRARFRNMVGGMYVRLGEQHRANDFFTPAVADQRETGDQLGLANALLEKAINDLRCCHYDQAYEAASESADLFQKYAPENMTSVNEILTSSSLCLSLKRRVWNPMANFQHHLVEKEIAKHLQERPDELIGGVVHNLIVHLFADLGKFESAENLCYRSLRSNMELVPSANVITYNHFLLGYLAEMQQEAESAKHHFRKVLEQKEQPGLLNSYNDWLEGMYAWAILRQGEISARDLVEADQRATTCVDFVERLGVMGPTAVMAYHVMAAVREKQERLASAIEFQMKALQLGQKVGIPKHMLFQLTVEEQLARLYLKSGDLAGASEFARQSIQWRKNRLPAEHYQHEAASRLLEKYLIE